MPQTRQNLAHLVIRTYRLFVDSLSNTGLILNETLAKGVVMNIMDVEEGKIARLQLWEDKPTIEAALMYPGRYVISTVETKDGEPILSASTDRLHNIAGTYVGKDDPICLIRTQKKFPAMKKLEVFLIIHIMLQVIQEKK